MTIIIILIVWGIAYNYYRKTIDRIQADIRIIKRHLGILNK